MLYAPDTGLGCLHQQDSCFGTPWHCMGHRQQEYRCRMQVWRGGTHVDSLCFPAGPVVRPLTGSDGGLSGGVNVHSVIALVPAGFKHTGPAFARTGVTLAVT